MLATATFDRVPVDEITARARKARPGHALATLVGGVLFGLFWLLGNLFTVVWFSLAWLWMACDEGWRSARGTGRPAPDMAGLMAENARLRAENARLS